LSWKKAVEEPAELRPESFFKPAEDVIAKHRRGLKVGVFGAWETGKTHFSLTFPEPVYVIDTEFGVAPVARKFPDKKIYILEACVIDPTTDEFDALASLEQFEEAVKSLKDVEKGTIVIDTGTDLWSWLGAWKESIGTIRSKKTGELLRTEWSHANEKYRNLIMKLLSRPTHFVMTGHVAAVYDSSGREITTEVEPRPHWMKKTPHWLDIILYTQKVYPSAQSERKTPEYIATVAKCRWERALNFVIRDVTFDKLCEALRRHLGIEIIA